MPKPHPPKPHMKGAGAKLVPAATDFLPLFTGNKAAATQWANDQLANEGPEHKQVLNAVLLQQLQQLVKAVEASSGQSFALQPGEALIAHKQEITIPISFPLPEAVEASKEAILQAIAKAPEHELLMYALLQQVTTWAGKVLTASK